MHAAHLTLNSKLAIVEVEKQDEEPGYRVFAGQAEVDGEYHLIWSR